MPPLELEARVRVLTFLQARGMAAADARGIDAACAQYAQGDFDEYDLCTNECFEIWRTNPALRPLEIVTRAVRPLDEPSATAAASTAAAGTQALGKTAAVDPPSVTGTGTLAQQTERRKLVESRDARRKAMRSTMSICPKCKSTDFTTLEFEKQQRAADEGADPWRRCENPKCRYEWRVRGIEVNERKTAPQR
jgi:DNA-directed RNA polymerase subunit M/transcription elongation factor TFIIS